MNHNLKKPQGKSENKNIAFYKDEDLAPKGRTKHHVETDWPTQEVAPKTQKQRQFKKNETARLP
ncbi:MAG: hypothetical protein K2Q18_06225 [Bdellovibrionales bacterium]|nr:hypothetical protein [Bdellovibrionales bacterium]